MMIPEPKIGEFIFNSSVTLPVMTAIIGITFLNLVLQRGELSGDPRGCVASVAESMCRSTNYWPSSSALMQDSPEHCLPICLRIPPSQQFHHHRNGDPPAHGRSGGTKHMGR